MEQPVYLEGTSVFIAGKEYQLISYGVQQARQVHGIMQWASKYGQEIFDAFQSSAELEGMDGLGFLLGILDKLSVDALIDLFPALTGCSEEEAMLYFDAATLIQAGIVVYEQHPTLRRLFDSFFSTSDTEQEEEQESSTTSE